MKSMFKYSIFLPILFIQFSCEDDPASSNETNCLDATANNTVATAVFDCDGIDSSDTTYVATTTANSCCTYTEGCTDIYACNYNAVAAIEDSTCTYPSTGYNCDGGSIAIVGTWELSALTGTYMRDVAQPTNSDPTAYALTASWNYAAAVMGADSALADQNLAAFSVGDTVLNQTSSLPSPAYLTYAGVAMTGVFNDQDVYTLNGTYPTLRLDEDACNTFQTVAQIADVGGYGVTSNSDNTGGTLSITAGDVLPPFDDAVMTFLNYGNTLNLKFEDRDSHDVDYAEVMDEWSEADDRVTMGIAQAPVDSTTGAFATEGTLSSSGFLMSEQLATWGGYMTWNALQYNGCVAAVVGAGGDGSSCETSHGAYLTNDSENSFDITCVGDGDPSDCAGKLTYNVNGRCIPVNEIILFDATFEQTTD